MRGSFHGSYVALPTPFLEGHVDFPAFLRLIELQIENGTDGLVVAGTTGEAATLSPDERKALIEYGVRVVRGRIPVLAGVGTNDTRTTCELAQAAQGTGAQGLLVVTPFYNKPTQRGLIEHYTIIAQAVPLPIVLYNVPSRTAVDLLPETVSELTARCSSVVAIKEASGSLERIAELIERDDVDVLCGEDDLCADSMLLGAKGVVGVVGNLVPARMAELVRTCRPDGDRDGAPALLETLKPLIEALFLETNPAPLKAALARLDRCSGELRPPLVPVEPETRARLEDAMVTAGLLP